MEPAVREEFFFRINGITINFVRLYNDCWICSLPHLVAEKLKLSASPFENIFIRDLGLSVRTTNYLLAANFQTAEDLLRAGKSVMKYDGIGKKTFKEINAKLQEITEIRK